MGENDSRKRGRPRKLEARHIYVPVRLTEKESVIVNLLADRYDISRSEVFRMAVEYMFKNKF